MSVKIRLTRMGRAHRPFYRIVVADARAPRDGRYIECLGTYNPVLDPPDVQIDEDRASYWLDQGAIPSDTVNSLLRNRGFNYKRYLLKKGLAGDALEEELKKWEVLQIERRRREEEKKKTRRIKQAKQAAAEEENTEQKAEEPAGVQVGAESEEKEPEKKAETAEAKTAEAKTAEAKIPESAPEPSESSEELPGAAEMKQAESAEEKAEEPGTREEDKDEGEAEAKTQTE